MAGNRQQFTLQFNADTTQAKKALQDLNNSLNAMMKIQHFDSGLHQDITEAAQAAKILQQELQKAVDVNTGKLNVSDFARGLSQAGTSLNELSNKLLQAGQTGQMAFNHLAQSIVAAEVPMKKMNATLSNALTTLKNTIKWEISSTFVHGLESAFSGAVSYAKNLNTSLTNIRIVTNQSVDDMARFTVQANKAAKELSTTTKAYADASLIYYQQGDNAEAVAKKAAITIKAANASFNSSAAEMSEYLTAVWNSYQVGADQLEHYVDIMAALGAKTATSLEEIATSMQKVAATANTVGVSMEQVSSIISTVSSVTRESAESIGTSYKTIFARIGDLKLGKTLDDGVTLGQVSSQLDKIGVSVLDVNGEMRDMGAIIEDLGSKWQTMSRAEQTAIAQVVAGKRQYTQLMALFGNWDMYQNNMTIASNADGELQRMANIYAESWEAASARVTASLESIYNKLINDQAIIKMTNSLASLIEGIESVIDGLGGMPGVLITVSNAFVTLFRNKIAGSINGAINDISNWGKSFKGMSSFQGIASILKGENAAIREYQRLLTDLRTKSVDSAGAATSVKEETNWINTTKIIEAKQRLLTIENSLSEAQKQTYQSLINDAANSLNSIQNLTNEYNEQKISLDQLTQSFATLTAQKEAYEKATGKTNTDLAKSGINMTTLIQQKWGESVKKFEYGQGKIVTNKDMGQIFNAQLGMGGPQLFAKDAEIQKTSASLEQLIQRFRALSQAAQGFSANASGFKDVFDNLKTDNISASLERLDVLFDALKASLQGTNIDVSWLDKLQQELHENSNDAETFKTKLQEALAQINAASDTAGASAGQAFSILAQKLGISDQKLTEIAEQAGLSAEQLRRLAVAAGLVNGNISTLGDKLKKGIGDAFSKIINGASSALASFSAMSSAIENWDDSTLISKVTSIGNTITNIGTQLASGNWIGAAMSAIGAGIGYLIGKIEAEKKRLEKILEFQNIRNTKNIEDDTTELKNLSSLMKEYSSLYETYQRTGEGQEQLSESANKLAEAYGLTGAAIAAITGNFSEFNKEVQETLSFTQQLANSESVYTKAQNTLLVTGTQKNYGLTQGSAFSSQDMIASSLDSYYRTQAQQYYNDFLVPNKEMSFVGEDANFTRTLYKNVIMPDAIDENGAWTHSGQLAVDVLVDKLWSLGLNKDKEAQAMMEAAFGSDWKKQSNGGIYHPNISAQDRTWDEVYNVLWSVADKVVSEDEYKKISLDDIGVSDQGLIYGLKGSWQGKADMHQRYMDTLIDEGYINNPQLIATLAMQDSMYGENDKFAHLFNEARTGLEWDPTTADEVVQQFKDYQDYYDYLTSVMTQLDPDSELYKTAVKIQTELNKVLQDETLKTSIDNYVQAKNNYAQWKLVDTTLKTTVGANEYDGEMSLNDYLSMEKTLTDQVEQNRNLFDSLAIFGDFKLLSEDEQAKLSPEELEKYQQTAEEYINARQKIVNGLFNDYTSLDEYTNMAQALSDAFGKDSYAYKQMANYIDTNKITTLSGTMLSAAQAIFAMNPNADLSGGTDQAFLNKLIEDKNRTSYSLTYDQMTAAKSSLKKDMSFEDASVLYKTFFEGQENAAQEWANFVAQSFEEKEKYIDRLITGAKAADQTSIQNARDAFKEQRDAWTSLMKETYGESIIEALINNKDFQAANSAFNEYINTIYDAQTDDNGNIISYTLKKGQTDVLGLNTALSSGDINSAFSLFATNYGTGQWKDLANLAPLSNESMAGLMQAFGVYSTLNSQYLEQDTLLTIMSAVGGSTGTSASLTESEKQLMQMQRIQKQVDALKNAVSEFQSTGKLSKSTKNTLEMLGINADDIDTVDELIDKITELQQKTKLDQWDDIATASGLDQTQLKEIFQDDGTIKGFNELATNSTITQEQYNNAIQAYEIKLAILGIDTEELKLQYQQAEATTAVNEAIKLQKQHVEELTKIATKATSAYEALSNNIGKSSLSFETMAKATQAGLDVSGWSSDVSDQLDIISKAAYQAYEAEMEVLEAQKNDFDDKKITNVQKLKTELSNLMKETTTDNDVNKFINDYFSNFNGATQEAVRNYITSMKAAGKELSWEGDNGLIAHLRAENILTDEEIALLKAKLKDGLTGVLDKAIAEHQVAAQKVADAWITAFDAIKKAKQGLADGKSIAESLIGDTESQAALLSQYFQNHENATNEEAMAWLRNRNLNQNADEFKPDSWSLSNWSQTRGIFSVANKNASQEGTNNEFAKTTSQWENWVNGRFQETWDALDDEAKKTMEVEDGITTYEEYVAKSWEEFLNGRTKEEAYWDERAAMIVAESDANQQWVNSQIETAQTTYKNTVEENQTKVDAWQQIYDAQNKVLADKTGKTTLETALDGNLQTVLDAINKGLNEEDQYTLADLEEMSISDIAAQINSFNANIANAEITLQNALSQGTDINGQTTDLSDTKAGEEALETASQTSAKATDASIDEKTVNEDVIKSLASSVNMTTDEFKQFTTAMIEAGEVTAETTEGQYKQARSLARIQTGLKTVRDGMKGWKKELKSTKGDIQAHNKVLSEMRSSFEDILDVPTGALNDLSEEFMTSAETAKLLKGAMEGDIDAYNKLQASVAEQILIGAGATVSPDVQNAINTIATEMDNLPINEPIEFGKLATVSPALYDALSSYVGAVAAAGGDVQAAAAALGFDLQYTTKEVPIEAMGPQYSIGGSFTTKDGTFTTVNASLNKETGMYTVTAIKAITNKGTHGGNIGGSHPKSSGGGGGSKPKKLDKKKPEDEKERYHYLEQQLKRLNESFTETDKLKDRTYGNKHLKNLEQEISLLKEQLDVQRDYIKAAKEYLAIDQQRVASLGATFDADGNITNYEEVMDSIIGKYNEFIDRYNSASASQQENMEEEKEEWDEWYEEKIEWISQYEETLATVNEKQNDLLETQNKISEAMLEKIQYKVEVKIDINKDEQDLLDYLSEKYDEVIEKQGVIMNNLIRESELAQDNIRALEQSRYELELAFNSGNINQADYVEGLRDINEQLLDNLKTINDVKKDIEELYSDTIEDASKVIDKQTQKINNASEAMKSYISILQLLGKGQNYEDLMYFYEKQYDYNKASLQTQMDLLEVLKQEEKYYLDRIDSATGLTETEREQYEALQETMQDVQKEILSSTESTLQSLQEKYNNTINSIMKNLEESIVGEGNSLNWLSEEYSYYLEEFNRYLSAQKQLYEVNKLNRNIDKSIADTTETLYRKQLKQLQDEINAKAESNSLSEYELNIMNLKYELLLKQIALEEAQNAKSTVRLTRDSEGNMIYQYTADADEISKAQQEYEDVLQQMVDANYEQIHNVEQQTIETYQNMVDKIKEIATDETLTQEQKMERIQEIVAQTNDTLRYLMEQYNITSENLMYTNELVSERYNTALWEHSENAKNNMNVVIDEMIANTDKYVAEMQAACGNGGSIQSSLEDYSTKVNEISELTSTKYGDMIDSVQNYDRVTEDAEDETRKMANELRNNLLPQIHTTTNAWDTYYKTLRTSITQTEALISKNNALISSLAQITQAAQRAQSAIASVSSARVSTPYGSAGGSSSGGGSNSSSKSGASKSTSSDTTATDGKYYLTVNGNKVGNGVYSASEAAKMAALQKKYGNYQSTDVVSWAQFATGGLADYTGPAWLDGTKNKPELILNPEDTQNMFRTIDAVRQLDKTTLNIMDDFINFATSSMMANMFNLHAGSTNGSSGELQQNVQITAEFPNVQDRNEIEAAFDNLINRASQFIGSKGRP